MNFARCAAAFALLVLPYVVMAAESTFAFDTWPALITADEEHRLAFHLTADAPSTAVVSWAGVSGQTFPFPAGDSIGLLPLPTKIVVQRGEVRLGEQAIPLAVHLADVTGPWPITGLRHGLPIDADGVPVVLVDHRRSANDRRRELLAPQALSRPARMAIVVGDPLATPDGDAWRGLNADLRPAMDERYPQHAVLVVLATLDRPRSVIWCPGNAALYAGTWAEESRLCAAFAHRCTALGIRPRLILALPPLPVSQVLRASAESRRQILRVAAQAAGWDILDLALIAGDPTTANRFAPGFFTDYPVGEAQQRIRIALREELRR